MKIYKLECPNCGHSFKPKEMDSICTCPACETSFYLDDEKQDIVNVNINNYGDSYRAKKNASSTKGVFVIIFIFIIFAFFYFSAFWSSGINEQIVVRYSYRNTPQSKPFIEFVKKVYSKNLEDITEEDYGKIKYIYVSRDCPSSDWTNADKYPWKFDYAYSVDENGNAVDVKSVIVDTVEDIECRDLQVFTNVVSANFGEYGKYTWDKSSYSNYNYKNLKNLKYYKDDGFLYNIVDAFDDPSKIEKLSIGNLDLGDTSEDELSAFLGLKTLNVDYVDDFKELEEVANFKNIEELNVEMISDDENRGDVLKFLPSLNNLKSLRLHFSSGTNFDNVEVLYGMPNIEKLDLSGIEELRSIDFVKNMPKLNSLSIEYCPIMDIEVLRDNVVITELNLENLGSLTDISSLPTIKNIKKLKLLSLEVEKENVPNINALSMLDEVNIDSDYLQSINGMTHISNLTVDDAYYLKSDILSSLTGVKHLKINIDDEDKTIITAISKLPNLERAEIYLDDMDKYYITPIFNSSTISELSIYNSKHFDEVLYIDFSNISENNVLKKLSINDIKVVDINANNDKEMAFGVYVDEFFKHFKSLEEVEIKNNQIKSLEFVSNLPNLKVLDISENYVSDVSPLIKCSKLQTIKCKNNTISNLNVLDKSVEVVKYK